jgi:threonine synthase
VARELLIAGRNAADVLRPVEGTFDPAAEVVQTPVEAKRLRSVAAVGNDRPGFALGQALAQFSAVVRLVADKVSR